VKLKPQTLRVFWGRALKTMLTTRRFLNLVAVCTVSGMLGAATAFADPNALGRELFQLCAQCHGPAGLGNPETLAPAIAGQRESYVKNQLDKFRSGARGMQFDDIGGMRMRPMALTLHGEAEVQAVAAYVASLQPEKPPPTLTGGDPARGQAQFALCMTCHGPNGGGNEQLNTPALNHASDWYLLRQLHNFRSGVRGADPSDAGGAMMRPMAATLPDDQALLDVIAYIMTLKPNPEVDAK